MKTAGDQAVRDRLLEDLDTTFVVEAAAGTGKTTVLVERIVRLVQLGRARLEEVISVTFTEKAAGEMKLRLRTRLERARHAATGLEHDRLVKALEELEVARISTIHGLCADLLREYPVEAGVDPLFEVTAEGDSSALLQHAFHRSFQQLLEAQPEGVRRALRRRSRGKDPLTARQQLFAASEQLIEHRDFTTPWRRDPFDRLASIDAALEPLRAFADFAPFVRLKPDKSSSVLQLLGKVRRFIDDLDHREAVSARDYDGLEALMCELPSPRFEWENDKLWGLQYSDGRSEAQLAAAKAAAWNALRDVVQRCEADLAACLQGELAPVLAAYDAEKAQRGVLDFTDLLLVTRDLLQKNATARASLQQRFTHLFLDEFQDTDPLQSEIVLLLASSDPAEHEPFKTRPVPGKLFVVGDPKQSIYRFRRADIALYQQVKGHLVANGARLEYLSTSFRSTPGIQAAVNGAFEPLMRGGHQADYVPLGVWREPVKDQPSVIALPAPYPFEQNARGSYVSKKAIERGVPDMVGAFIDWLVNSSGWTVDEDGQRVAVQPRHICILFKRLQSFGADIPRPYAQALEARKVPHVLVGGRSFHHREEVMALRTALFAIDRPEDELSVYATLRGPFFAFTDEALFSFKSAIGKLHPLRPFDTTGFDATQLEVVQALEVLKGLHRERNERPVAMTVHHLLEATRAHAGVAFWKAGAQALANVLQLAEVSRRHERRSTSFREAVESLQDEADSGEAPEAPIVEQGIEGVRMMTVHAAKGLEFPVVVLAEPTANAVRSEPSHWVDPQTKRWVHTLAGCVPSELREHEHEALERDAEEALRLTYVAATRAKDLLVLPASSEKQFDKTWTSPLIPVLLPASPHTPKPAPGCPAFGDDVIIDRGGPVPLTVPRPGLHVSQAGKNGVVWWDPKTLQLGQREVSGLEADEALREDGVESAASIEAYAAWKQSHSDAVAVGVVPVMKVVVARELDPTSLTGVVPIEKTDAARSGRPGGRRFGELVHACLATIPLEASAVQVRSVVEVMSRSLRAPDDEREAAAVAVEAALKHPQLVAARAARQARREVSLVDHLPDGTVVEGVIDLAYETDDGWVVVEFKTDDSLERNRVQYETQTLAYVRAISAATGKPASGVILQV